MLRVIGVGSLAALIDEALPRSIRLEHPLALPPGESEHQFLRRLTHIARRNKTFRSYIGLGYHDTITPSVIQRMVLENPGWYTPYTPYQAEIAQAGSSRSSTSRPWCATSPPWKSPTHRSSTKPPPRPRR